MNVLFITNIPSPYRVAFFRELGKRVDLTVLYETIEAKDRERGWVQASETEQNGSRYIATKESDGYEGIVLPAKRRGTDSAFCPSVKNYLTKDYDRIIVGVYSTATGRYAIRYMKQHHISYWLSCDGGFCKADSYFKGKIKRYFLSGAAGYLSSGIETDQYLIHYGADPDRIMRYEFTSVREEDILQHPLTTEEKQGLRAQYCPELVNYSYVILGVGQMIHRKGWDLLLQAAEDLPKDIGVAIMGGAPTDEYVAYVKEKNLANVHFLPFQTYETLQFFYRMADLFVLPTREDIWGLVINEAMANGLPVVTTDRCNAGIELVQNGLNGMIIPTESPNALRDAILQIYQVDAVTKDHMAKAVLQVMHGYTIKQMAKTHVRWLSQKRVLFLGTRISESELLQLKSVSAAANRFQDKFLYAISQIGDAYRELTFVPEKLTRRLEHPQTIYVEKTASGIRGVLQAMRAMRQMTKKEIDGSDVVFCYNVFYMWLFLPGLCRRYHRKSILILADYSSADSYQGIVRKLYAKLQLRTIRKFDLVVGLSKQLQKDLLPSQKFVLMEGGIDRRFFERLANPEESVGKHERKTLEHEKGQKTTLVYSGLLNSVAGIDLLLQSMQYVQGDVTLRITGRGELEQLVADACKKDSRIEYLGLVPEEQYVEVLKGADILVNPRNMNLPENQNNFPSKVMDYLASGHRIISTKFAGYEKFAEVISFCEADVKSLAEAINQAIHEVDKADTERYQQQREFAKQFLWERQIKRILHL